MWYDWPLLYSLTSGIYKDSYIRCLNFLVVLKTAFIKTLLIGTVLRSRAYAQDFQASYEQHL